MKNKLMLASIIGAGLMTVGIATYAYQGNPGTMNPDCTDTERHAAVQEVFEKSDYESFKTLYADKGVMKRVDSQEKFEKFAELRKAKLAGDTEKAANLASELNLGQKRMDGDGKMNGRKGMGTKGGFGMNK
ncbi:MAG TPA: hypothetical protein VJ892_02335 [Candidatus Absconditabacterales bacterium]|nr:hypothetical protein [Candidatus Absconditabacterales bacterium]